MFCNYLPIRDNTIFRDILAIDLLASPTIAADFQLIKLIGKLDCQMMRESSKENFFDLESLSGRFISKTEYAVFANSIKEILNSRKINRDGSTKLSENKKPEFGY